MVADSICNADKKMSYYREHTHALASGVSADRIMAELFAKDGGTCRGAGGSMHIYDKDTHFQVEYSTWDYVPLLFLRELCVCVFVLSVNDEWHPRNCTTLSIDVFRPPFSLMSSVVAFLVVDV